MLNNFMNTQGNKLLGKMRTMTDQQIISEFWSQSNSPGIPQQLKDYLMNNKEKINEAIVNLRKQKQF